MSENVGIKHAKYMHFKEREKPRLGHALRGLLEVQKHIKILSPKHKIFVPKIYTRGNAKYTV